MLSDGVCKNLECAPAPGKHFTKIGRITNSTTKFRSWMLHYERSVLWVQKFDAFSCCFLCAGSIDVVLRGKCVFDNDRAQVPQLDAMLLILAKADKEVSSDLTLMSYSCFCSLYHTSWTQGMSRRHLPGQSLCSGHHHALWKITDRCVNFNFAGF